MTKDYNTWGIWFLRTVLATLLFVGGFATYTRWSDALDVSQKEHDYLLFEEETDPCKLPPPPKVEYGEAILYYDAYSECWIWLPYEEKTTP